MKYLKNSLVFFLMLLFVNTFAQTSSVETADKAYADGKYTIALELYKNITNKTHEVNANIAACYYYTRNYKMAKSSYSNFKREDLSAEHLINLANIYLAYGKFSNADETFGMTLEKGADNQLVKTYMNSCSWAKNQGSVSHRYDVAISDAPAKGINFGATYYNDGVVFAWYDDENKNALKDAEENVCRNLYFATQDKGEFGEHQLFAQELVFPNHEGAVSFSADKNTIYFMREMPLSGKKESAINGMTGVFLPSTMLYKAVKNESKWSKIKALKFCSEKYNYYHPSLSQDGQMLFFASDMPGGLGGLDIYVSHKKGKKWGKPQNLGDSVNTVGNEIYPFIAKDSTLYFSSDGHIGYGGFDIYSSKLIDEKWGAVTNEQELLNSAREDFAFSINPKDSTEGFVVSNREGKGTTYSLYTVRKYPEDTELQGQDYSQAGYFDPDAKDNDFNWGVQKVYYPDPVGANSNTNESKNITVEKDSVPTEIVEKEKIYTVELLSTESSLMPSASFFNGLEVMVFEMDSVYKYTSGIFKAKSEATILLRIVESLGMKNAVIIEYEENKKVNGTLIRKKSYIENEMSEIQGQNELFYKVQFLTTVASLDIEINGLKVDKYLYENKWHYTVGKYSKLNEATDLRNHIISLGYTDAFIAIFKNGKRVD